MARAAAQSQPARRQAAPPPVQEPEEQGSVYDEVWGVVTDIDPNFQPPHDKENDQAFIQRLLRAISALPPEVTLSQEAEAWYNTGADQWHAKQEIDAPPGYNDEGGEDQGEEQEGEGEEVAEQAAAPAKPVHKGTEALRKHREQKQAEKAAAAQQPQQATRRPPPAGNAAPGRQAPPARQAPPQAAPGRRPAPAPQQQQAPARAAAPGRRAAPAAPPQRQQRQAPQPAEEKGPSLASAMRRFIIENLDCTGDDVAAYLQSDFSHLPTPKHSTIAGVLTFTKNTVMEVKDLNHWKD